MIHRNAINVVSSFMFVGPEPVSLLHVTTHARQPLAGNERKITDRVWKSCQLFIEITLLSSITFYSENGRLC